MNTAWLEGQKPALNGCKNKKEIEGGGQQYGEEGLSYPSVVINPSDMLRDNNKCVGLV